jgi:C-terminal processing protease CtpA/Prc
MGNIKHFLIISIVICSTVCSAPSLPIFLIDANTVILNQYVNPRNIDLEKWSAQLRQRALLSCSTQCDEETTENILVDEVRQIDDPHFWVFNPVSKRIEDSFPVGDGRHISSFGFILEHDQSEIIVRYVHPTTPAADAFQFGDRILSVRGVPEKNTLRAIAFAERFGKQLEFKYSRDGDVKTVQLFPGGDWKTSHTVLDKKVLWLQVTSTSENSDRIIHDAIQVAKTDNIEGIVLDLRYRSGGDPFTGLNIAGAFVPFIGTKFCDNTQICIDYSFKAGAHEYFNHQTGERSTEYLVNPSFWDKPLVVLTSKYTFSGGENVANILQGLKRAKVLGEESRGGAGVTGNYFDVRFAKKTQTRTSTDIMILLPTSHVPLKSLLINSCQ